MGFYSFFIVGFYAWIGNMTETRHAHFPRFRGAETEALDLRDRDFEK